MIHIPKVNDSTYYLGVNDRVKARFENLWPIPNGVAYNSYLIVDEKTVLMDTVDVCYADVFLHRLDKALDGRKLDYLVVNHMEPDHSGSIALLKNKYPDVVIVGNKRTMPMLKGFQHIDSSILEVDESTELNIGSRSLRFVMAPMVHWPEVMFTYDPLTKTLFSADAFGSFGTLDGGVLDEEVDREGFLDEVYRYYSNIVGKYGAQVQRALKKAAEIDIEMICSTHGPVWSKHAHEILDIYDRISKYEAAPGATILYGSMYGNTEQMAELLARSLSAHGVKKVRLHHMGVSHSSYALADVFRYKGVIIGSPTYNMELWPPIADMVTKISDRGVPNRVLGFFGSGAWNGAVEKKFGGVAERLGWPIAADPVMMQCGMSDEVEAQLWEMGKRLAEAILAE